MSDTDPAPRNPAYLAPRPSRAWMIVAIVFILLFCFSVLSNCAMLLAVAGARGDVGAGRRHFTPQVIEADGPDQILVIDIHGVISSDSGGGAFGMTTPSMVDTVKLQLKQAADDVKVKAVLLAIDSPGGGVTASDEIYHAVKNFRELSKKPVVVHMEDLCASGGYYISAAADQVVASPTTITGSIGVILGTMDAHQLLNDKLGVVMNPVISGPFKDIGSMSRPMRDEERKILQTLVDSMYERFVGVVAAGRAGHGTLSKNIDEATAQVKIIADGRIYTGDQALANGLVDSVGYQEDAVALTAKLAGISSPTLVRYSRPAGLFAALAGEAENASGKLNANQQVDMIKAVRDAMTPKMEYRWQP